MKQVFVSSFRKFLLVSVIFTLFMLVLWWTPLSIIPTLFAVASLELEFLWLMALATGAPLFGIGFLIMVTAWDIKKVFPNLANLTGFWIGCLLGGRLTYEFFGGAA